MKEKIVETILISTVLNVLSDFKSIIVYQESLVL